MVQLLTAKDAGALCDQRLYAPRKAPLIGAVLHTTDGRNSQAWLQGGCLTQGVTASADILVQRSGNAIRLVPHKMHSYHAGWARRIPGLIAPNEWNERMLGIEVENFDTGLEVPTREQHIAVAAILLRCAFVHRWSPIHVYGHGAIALPVGRRSDPQAWNWGYMMWLMAHAQELLMWENPTIIA